MNWMEISGKTVEEALANALLELGTTMEDMEYEVIEKETAGFLGMFGKPARIKARIKMTIELSAKKFLEDVFHAMGINAAIEVVFDKENETIEVNIDGEEMGVLIGKRGQTLDSLQYLVSLVINKNSENYIKVKLDTENYRARRKETLENLAKNIAFKVKKTRKPVSLEPMNPYERRIIHSALQNDKYVETYSEGEEPNRKVVINIKKSFKDAPRYNNNRSGGYKKDYSNSGHSSHSGHSSQGSHNSQDGRNAQDSRNSSQGSRTGQGGYSGQTSRNGVTNKNYKKPYNTSKSGYNKNYSADYKKDYELYKESKIKKDQTEETAAE